MCFNRAGAACTWCLGFFTSVSSKKPCHTALCFPSVVRLSSVRSAVRGEMKPFCVRTLCCCGMTAADRIVGEMKVKDDSSHVRWLTPWQRSSLFQVRFGSLALARILSRRYSSAYYRDSPSPGREIYQLAVDIDANQRPVWFKMVRQFDKKLKVVQHFVPIKSY